MLKNIELLNIFVEIVMFISSILLMNSLCNITNVFTVTFI